MDLHEVYGIDVGDDSLMKSRSWRWLSARILGLLSTECRTQRVLNPQVVDGFSQQGYYE